MRKGGEMRRHIPIPKDYVLQPEVGSGVLRLERTDVRCYRLINFSTFALAGVVHAH